MKQAMYKRYANVEPVGTIALSNVFGICFYEPDENDKIEPLRLTKTDTVKRDIECSNIHKIKRKGIKNMKKWYTITINGQKAVDIGYSIQKNHCYHVIKNDNKYLTQIEVVVDDDGFYNGNPNKWVDVSYIEHENVEKVLSILCEIGFSGCPAILMEEHENGYILEQKELCCFII